MSTLPPLAKRALDRELLNMLENVLEVEAHRAAGILPPDEIGTPLPPNVAKYVADRLRTSARFRDRVAGAIADARGLQTSAPVWLRDRPPKFARKSMAGKESLA